MTRLEHLRSLMEAGFCHVIDRASWDGFESCAEECDDNGKPRCPFLHHECGDCYGCYADEFDTEPEPDAECTGGGVWTCTLRDTLAALLDVAEAANDALKEAVPAPNYGECIIEHGALGIALAYFDEEADHE